MIGPANLESFLGNPRTVEVLRRAIRLNRLPHALIFAGPAGVGKRTLAVLTAEYLNCLSPRDEDACGACRSCRKVLSGTHPDVLEIEPDGAFIKIEQVRALIDEIAYQPFEGRYRIAILDKADQMRGEASNSLLKTLEEPPSRSFIILVTTNPYALLGTIRSRSRLLQFGGIPAHQLKQYLVNREGKSAEEAGLAALFSKGSLSAALSFNTGQHQEARERALQLVKLLSTRKNFAETSALATEICKKEKDKAVFLLWLDAIETVLQDLYYAHVAPECIGQQDILPDLLTLAVTIPPEMIVSTTRALSELKADLLHNVNRQLAFETLYLKEISRH